MNYKPFLNLINEFETIVIFRHTNPDGDAVGSQLGLKSYLKSNFPKKYIYALGEGIYDKYPFVDNIDDDVIKESLAIVLDTPTQDRIDDKRYILAKKIIKIDHHPLVQEFGDLSYVDTTAAATAELLTTILASNDLNDLNINKEAAKYLYSGIITDTLSFKTSNTTFNTLECASILAKTGISIYDITKYLLDIDYATYDYCSYIRSSIKYDNGLAVVIIKQDELQKYEINSQKARSFVSELNGVSDFRIWALFTENESGNYDGSLRSDKEYAINQIAAKYNGGGHKNAAGVKNLTTEQLTQIQEELKELLK